MAKIIYGLQGNLATNVDSPTTSFNLGCLYNWYAVNNASLLEPLGFHIPTDTEWTTLKTYMTTNGYSGIEGKGLKSTDVEWFLSANNTNAAYFFGDPGGLRWTDGGFYLGRGSGFWWTDTQMTATQAYYRSLNFNLDTIIRSGSYYKNIGMSVRCIRNSSQSVVYDKDFNSYNTIIIGNQEWLQSNLKVTQYANGTAIPNVTSNASWAADSTGAYCRYDGSGDWLYNAYAVNNVNGLAYITRGGVVENGWRVPTDADFTQLTDYLGGNSVAGGKLKEDGTSHWQTDHASNSSLFTALPTGWRVDDGNWSGGSTPLQTTSYWMSGYSGNPLTLEDSDTVAYRGAVSSNAGLSVRLVRDTNQIQMIDSDSNIYNCIDLGGQIWTTSNLKTTKYRDGSPINKLTTNVSWIADTTGAYCSYNNDDTNV